MPIRFQELLDAFELSGMAPGSGEYETRVCRRTGTVYLRSEFSDEDPAGEKLPDDIEDDEKYFTLPDKRDLDLGKPLVLSFARECLPDDIDDVYDMFRRKGAYANFKALLARRNALDRWYEFEAKATERALREWCELNSIALTD